MKIKLTKREREILVHACLPIKDVAERLGIEIVTVKTHLANISCKFPEQPSKFCILLEALKRGIITLDEIVTE